MPDNERTDLSTLLEIDILETEFHLVLNRLEECNCNPDWFDLIRQDLEGNYLCVYYSCLIFILSFIFSGLFPKTIVGLQ